MDHIEDGSSLAVGHDQIQVFTSPYSNGCKARAELAMVETLEQLERIDCTAKLLLLRGEICSEQLTPKNFVFYNPDHHRKVTSLLEMKKPAAIITATRQNPDQAGALDPFPLIVDGDFDIPSVFCSDEQGQRLERHVGETVDLDIRAERVPSRASNAVAKLRSRSSRKVILTAHIDAYEDSPGASDNASGTTVLLIASKLLADYQGDFQIEISALNGEDHYSAAGQMDYLSRYGNELTVSHLAVNIDDVGYLEGGTSFSLYRCSEEIAELARSILGAADGLVEGPQWFNGDHMIFVQKCVAAAAFTAERMPYLMETITHTRRDTPELLDAKKIVELAAALNRLVRAL
jgi:aminopeptidase YwaD